MIEVPALPSLEKGKENGSIFFGAEHVIALAPFEGVLYRGTSIILINGQVLQTELPTDEVKELLDTAKN